MSWNNVIEDQNKKEEIEGLIKKISSKIELNKLKIKDHSLFNGYAGLLIFNSYENLYFNEKSKKIELGLNTCFEKVKSTKMIHSFCSGFTGISWLANFLKKEDFIQFQDNDPTSDIDEYIYKFCKNDLEEGQWDFLHGGLGLLFYIINKYENLGQPPAHKNKIRDLLDIFIDKSENYFDEFKVWPPKSRMAPSNIEIDFGLAHGMLSIIRILELCITNNIRKNESIKIIKNISKLYLFMYRPSVSKQIFPTYMLKSKERVYNRKIGWCYGDIASAYVLYLCSITIKDKQLEQFSINIIDSFSNNFKEEKNNVSENGLCHGTSGIAHIYSRMYNHTDNNTYKKTAAQWLELTINKLNSAFDNSQENTNINDFGFLEGLSGIGLVLISSISNIEPKWDKILLLS